MSQHGEDFSVVNHRYKTVYDEFCKKGDSWFNTPIADYIKISNRFIMIDEPNLNSLTGDTSKKRSRINDQLIQDNIVLKKKN
jgi:hypothetical protein